MIKNEILPYPEIKPIEDNAKRLVVFLHGFGSDGHDLISLAPLMQDRMADCHFISPHGVEPCESSAFGRQWFSLYSRNYDEIQKIIPNNSQLLASIISEKQQELNLTNSDTILIGFSQGTMIGIYTTLTQQQNFAAMIGFSGRLIPPTECANIKTPICLIHGEQDEVIEASAMDSIVSYLTERKIYCQSLKIPNLAHSIDATGIEYAINFINSIKK